MRFATPHAEASAREEGLTHLDRVATEASAMAPSTTVFGTGAPENAPVSELMDSHPGMPSGEWMCPSLVMNRPKTRAPRYNGPSMIGASDNGSSLRDHDRDDCVPLRLRGPASIRLDPMPSWAYS